MVNLIEMDDLGEPIFREPPKLWLFIWTVIPSGDEWSTMVPMTFWMMKPMVWLGGIHFFGDLLIWVSLKMESKKYPWPWNLVDFSRSRFSAKLPRALLLKKQSITICNLKSYELYKKILFLLPKTMTDANFCWFDYHLCGSSPFMLHREIMINNPVFVGFHPHLLSSNSTGFFFSTLQSNMAGTSTIY